MYCTVCTLYWCLAYLHTFVDLTCCCCVVLSCFLLISDKRGHILYFVCAVPQAGVQLILTYWFSHDDVTRESLRRTPLFNLAAQRAPASSRYPLSSHLFHIHYDCAMLICHGRHGMRDRPGPTEMNIYIHTRVPSDSSESDQDTNLVPRLEQCCDRCYDVGLP